MSDNRTKRERKFARAVKLNTVSGAKITNRVRRGVKVK